MHSNNFIDMTGWIMSEHGVPDSRIKVLYNAGKDKHGAYMWMCKCLCGSDRIWKVSGGNLRSGHVISCGCLQKEIMSKVKTRHGDSHKNRLYTIWCGMKSRCFNKNNSAYMNYGGRGISMCEEWIESYADFKNWAINNGYNDSLTIERINVDGNYEPNNCKWATWKEQGNNTRRNDFIEYNGEKHTITEWAEKIGVLPSTLWARINKYNMSIDEALNLDINLLNKSIEYNGENHTLCEWSEITGINKKTLYNRIYLYGWDVSIALSTPTSCREKIIKFNGESHNIQEWSKIFGIKAGTIAYRLRENWPLEKVFSAK